MIEIWLGDILGKPWGLTGTIVIFSSSITNNKYCSCSQMYYTLSGSLGVGMYIPGVLKINIQSPGLCIKVMFAECP